ncbi:MAG: hypothetical protein ACKVHP_07090 [Verrucomicrobiales bacterium]
MYLRSLASAFPADAFTQAECWDCLESHGKDVGLKDRSMTLLKKVLLGDSGIDRRHFALGDPNRVFGLNAQGLNEAFEKHAPDLGAQALRKALDEASLRAEDLDALFVCTCTGYLCPGVSSHVAERVGLRSDAYLIDSVGNGCGAAIPLLRAAHGFLNNTVKELVVATVCVEVCSTAFYIDDDPGVLISLCLFGDGASASIWGNKESDDSWAIGAFRTCHWPKEREKIRFVNRDGKLRNQLHRSVPGLAAQAVAGLYAGREGEPDQVLSHTGGRDVLMALMEALPGRDLQESARVLRKRGNVSSPSVMMALEERLSQTVDEERLWMTSFGAGFSAHACELVRGHDERA